MRESVIRKIDQNVSIESSFAFIIHPSDYKHLKQIFPYIDIIDKFLPEFLIKKLLFQIPPLKILRIPFSFDGPNRKVLCWGILCPLLPVQMVTAECEAISIILAAIEQANSLGCKIVGLGGFTSIIGGSGLEIAKKSRLPVTSGNTYTAAVIIQSIRRAADLLELNLKGARIAVIGATGDIGSACAQQLVKYCESLVLVARNEERLEQLLSSLKADSNRVEVERSPSKAAMSADIVITVTSAMTTLLEPDTLKSGAIVCDASYPANILNEIRQIRDDILVYEGGLVEWPELREQIPSDNPFWRFNSPMGVHGCFAETLLLALENMHTTYSIGRGNISSQRIASILSIAEKYKFNPSRFWHGQGGYTDRDIYRIKKARFCTRQIVAFEAPHTDSQSR